MLAVILALASLAIIQLNKDEKIFAAVSVDINPSLQLNLNEALRVVSAEAKNPEAKALMAGIQFKNMFWQDAVAEWTEIVIEEYPDKADLVLVSAVMPENALALKNQLEAMRSDDAASRLRLREVEVLYSNDERVIAEAKSNGLSVGRQMLMNQASTLTGNDLLTAEEVEAAPLAQMIRTMLQGENRDMTGQQTAVAAQNLGESAGENAPSDPRATNREQNMEQNQPEDVTAPEQAETVRQTNRETINQNDEIPGRNPQAGPSETPEKTQAASETNGSVETMMQTEQNRFGTSFGPDARFNDQD